jgi:membrane associated rhomboid family serine protease
VDVSNEAEPLPELHRLMTDETDDTQSPDWASLAWVGNYPTSRDAHEHGLVILAMRHAYWVNPLENGAGFALMAEPEQVTAIQREISAYDREQFRPAPRIADETDVFQHDAGWGLYAVWMLALVLVFLWQHSNPGVADRFASSSTGLFSRGEWWRPFTALFLHADASHLIGNLLSGLLFGTLVSRSIGALRGWALILASGAIGNTLTSAITWPDAFTSIGASTAVFGALGILSGVGFSAMLRARLNLSWARTAAPVIAGIVLLGWLGGGSEGGNTDVLGHVFGFSSGLIAGWITGQLTPSTADASIAGNATAARGAST